MNTGFKLIRMGIMIMIVFSCFAALPNLFSEEAEAVQGMPTVNIALTEQSKVANVGPGETGVVTFTGVISVTLNQATRVVVSLTAEDTWGTAVASPSSVLFSANGDKPFGVSVRARPRESFTNTGTVTVIGRWSMYPGGLSGPANPQQGAVGRVDINQFFKFTLKSPKAFIETSPGSQIVYTLTIQNRGNFMDTFSVDVTNYDKLSKKHFEVVLTQSNIEILENPAEENIRIQVNTPLDWTVYKVEYSSIKVQVTSDKGVAEGIPPQTFTFVVREKGFYIPGFDSSVMLFSLMFILIFFSYGYKKYGRRD
jgi:hypothetical protein